MKTENERGAAAHEREVPTANDRAEPSAPPRTIAPTEDRRDDHRTPDDPGAVGAPESATFFLRPRSDTTSRRVSETPILHGRTCTVDASADVPLEHVFRQLVAAYLAGADEFVVAEQGGLRPATRELVRTFTRRTSGPEVVAEAKDRVTLQIAPDRSRGPLSHELRQMYDLVARSQETAGTYLTGVEPLHAADLALGDDAIDRHAWLIERTLNGPPGAQRPAEPKALAVDPIQVLLLTRALERVADHAVTLGTCAAQLSDCAVPVGVLSSLQTHHRQVVDHLRHAYEVSEIPDVARANEILDTGDALHEAHRTLTESLLVRGAAAGLTPLASANLGLALQSIDRTTAYAQDIAQVGLDRAIVRRLATGDAVRSEPRAGPRRAAVAAAVRGAAS